MVAGYTYRSCRTIACQQLYETDTLSLEGVIISEALPNSYHISIVTNVNLDQNRINNSARTLFWNPGSIVIYMGPKTKVIVQATVKIVLKDYEVPNTHRYN